MRARVAITILLAAVAPVVARAEVVVFTGIIDGPAFDGAGLFGGGNLQGASIVSTWTYSLGNGARRSFQPGLSDSVYGGVSYGTAIPVLSLAITVHGVTRNFSTGWFGTVGLCANCAPQAASAGLQDQSGASINNILSGPAVAGLVPFLGAAQYLSGTNAPGFRSQFYWGGDNFFFTDLAVSFNGAAPVPEPGAVATFGVGMMALGVARWARVRARAG